MVSKRREQKFKHLLQMIDTGVPAGCYLRWGQQSVVTSFLDGLHNKKKSLKNILALQKALIEYTEQWEDYQFDAVTEIKASQSNVFSIEELSKSKHCFKPLKGGALSQIIDILKLLDKTGNSWMGFSSVFNELERHIAHHIKQKLLVIEFLGLPTRNKGSCVTYKKLCENDCRVGKDILLVIQQASNEIFKWVDNRKKSFYFSGSNSAKKRDGLKSYVSKIVRKVEKPYVIRVVLIHGSSNLEFVGNFAGVLASWNELRKEKKAGFWNHVQGFFWKAEVVAEFFDSERKALKPVWGVQLVLIFETGYGAPKETEIVSALSRDWVNCSRNTLIDSEIAMPGRVGENVVVMENFCFVYLASKSELSLAQKIKESNIVSKGIRGTKLNFAETLHGEFNKKDKESKKSLGFLLDYFALSDVVFPFMPDEGSRQKMTKKVQDLKREKIYSRSLKTFGRGQAHKKHKNRQNPELPKDSDLYISSEENNDNSDNGVQSGNLREKKEFKYERRKVATPCDVVDVKLK